MSSYTTNLAKSRDIRGDSREICVCVCVCVHEWFIRVCVYRCTYVSRCQSHMRKWKFEADVRYRFHRSHNIEASVEPADSSVFCADIPPTTRYPANWSSSCTRLRLIVHLVPLRDKRWSQFTWKIDRVIRNSIEN